MFSLNGLQTQQVVLPLSHVVSVWNAVRNSAQGVVGRPYTKPRQSVNRTSTAKDANTFDITENISTSLQDLGLGDLPTGTKVEAISDFFCLKNNATSPEWKSDYTSSQSFFENKYGFTESQLWSRTFDCVPLSNINALRITIPPTLTTRWVPRTVLQQTRGFQNRRSRQSPGIGKRKPEAGESFSPVKFFRESVLDKVSTNKTKQPEKYKSLLANFEHSPDVKEKLKIAFAEGYAANEKKESEPIGGWTKRAMRVFMYGLIIYLAFQLIQGYSAIGGNMKGLNVLKGERYEVNPEDITVSFEDVKGVDEAKQELKDVVEFLRDPEKFKALGAKLPKGVLLVGPPGIGKTLLARAVAGEAGVPFFHASGSEFDEIFVGTGAKRVRQLFDAAKMRAPCVVFIDEIDTVGAKRTSSQIHPYANQTINQLLAEMDGFQQNEGVIVLGATNRRDNLDKAILRPGRFDVEVRVFPPDLKGRRDILELYLSKIKVDPNVEVEALAKGTTGFTGADLENIVNQAALKAAMDNCKEVTLSHLEFAKDKVLMGPAKKTRIPDESTNLMTAYHEAGHTLVAYYTRDATPLHKVTIVPRGMSLGHTSFVPEKEEYNKSRSQLLAQMDVAMGGRVAEELVYGADKVTTGAGSDFSTATAIATAMVKKFGMSEKVGVRVFDDQDAFDSGLSMLKVNEVSPATTELVDSEIKRLLQESYERAKAILRAHSIEHKALAQALMKYETLDTDDIKAIVNGKKLNKEPAS